MKAILSIRACVASGVSGTPSTKLNPHLCFTKLVLIGDEAQQTAYNVLKPFQQTLILGHDGLERNSWVIRISRIVEFVIPIKLAVPERIKCRHTEFPYHRCIYDVSD